MEDIVYFHEDDYCQIEVLPLSLWDYCLGEMRRIDDFADAHRAAIGWTDIYVREKAPQTIREFAITLDDLSANLEKTLAPYSKVTTGYSTHVENCEEMFAWRSRNQKIKVFAQKGAGNLIDVIWLDIGVIDDDELAQAAEALANLPHGRELMIADWWRSEAAAVGKRESLNKYLRLHHIDED